MNRKRVRCAREFLVTQINHWALFPVWMLFLGVAAKLGSFDAPGPLLWLEIGILPAAFAVFRRKMRHFWTLLASHGAAVALLGMLVVLEFPSSGWVYVPGAGCYAAYSVFHRLGSGDAQEGGIHLLAAGGISAVSLWVQHFQGCAEWDFWYAAALIAVAAMHYFSVYLERYLNFLAVNESSTGQIPEREIFQSGSRLAVFFVLFSVLVLLLISGLEWLRPILAAVRDLILGLLRRLLSGGTDGEQELLPDKTAEPPGGGAMELPEAGEPFFLWEVLEVIVEVAAVCGLICLAVWFLLRLSAWIRERMGNLQVFQAGAEAGSSLDVRERCGIEKPKGAAWRRNPFVFLSAQERIRRLYQAHILSFGRMQVSSESENTDPSLLTAREWGIRLGQEGIAAPYERARYSGEECTAEDVRAMKEACRKELWKNNC